MYPVYRRITDMFDQVYTSTTQALYLVQMATTTPSPPTA